MPHAGFSWRLFRRIKCFSSIPGNCLAPLDVLQRVRETVASALWEVDENVKKEHVAERGKQKCLADM